MTTSTKPIFAKGASSEKAKKTYIRSIARETEYELLLGKNTTKILLTDPKLLGFMCARHKFVAKMFDGYGRVVEVGCQEGFGSLIVAKSVHYLYAFDFFSEHIESCERRLSRIVKNIKFEARDALSGPAGKNFDGAFALDVLEHIDPKQEDLFMSNIAKSLSGGGVAIIGMPSLQSQAYASAASRLGHVNCKTGDDLVALGRKHFKQVFQFGMNDEMLHTGFRAMSHYLLILCVGPRKVR